MALPKKSDHRNEELVDMLRVNNLSKSFSQGETNIHAVKDVSFELQSNSRLAITGSSGSGKSTLLSLIAGLDQADNGEIHFENQRLDTMDAAAWSNFRSENMGIVFQEFHLMSHLTAFENVSLPLDIQNKGNDEAVQSLLKSVGLGDRMHHMPNQLSGGEKQRVALARACICKPRLLLADEPSGNLDTLTGKKVMNLLFELAEKHQLSLLLVTHDLELAARCDAQIKMSSGSIV